MYRERIGHEIAGCRIAAVFDPQLFLVLCEPHFFGYFSADHGDHGWHEVLNIGSNLIVVIARYLSLLVYTPCHCLQWNWQPGLYWGQILFMTQRQRYAFPVHPSSVLVLMTKTSSLKDVERSYFVLSNNQCH